VPPAIFRCRSELVSNAAGSQGIDLVAPHVEIVGLADGFELACNDEIEHLASFDAEQGSQRKSAAVAAMSRTYSTASRDGQPRCRQRKGKGPVW